MTPPCASKPRRDGLRTLERVVHTFQRGPTFTNLPTVRPSPLRPSPLRPSLAAPAAGDQIPEALRCSFDRSFLVASPLSVAWQPVANVLLPAIDPPSLKLAAWLRRRWASPARLRASRLGSSRRLLPPDRSPSRSRLAAAPRRRRRSSWSARRARRRRSSLFDRPARNPARRAARLQARRPARCPRGVVLALRSSSHRARRRRSCTARSLHPSIRLFMLLVIARVGGGALPRRGAIGAGRSVGARSVAPSA